MRAYRVLVEGWEAALMCLGQRPENVAGHDPRGLDMKRRYVASVSTEEGVFAIFEAR